MASLLFYKKQTKICKNILTKQKFVYIILLNKQYFVKKEIFMISTIQIKNIGIIDDLSINLENGFNALTGETGAGKTLIIDSLGILCGNRFSKEMIRKGENYSYVEACLYLPENENAIDGNVIVSREIYSNGRNTCKINGRLVTVNELKDFMKQVIDIHGQNENQTLLDSASHIDYLDNFIGEEVKKIKQEYYLLYQKNAKLQKELTENYGDEKEKQRRLDLLQYQIKEIQMAHLQLGEEEILEEQRKIMLHAEKIESSLKTADMVLNENAIDSISEAIKALEKIEDIDKTYQEKLAELKNIYYEVQEVARDINSLKGNTEFEEEEQNNIENRLDLLYSLKRKYGNNIEEILAYQKEMQLQIEQIENREEENKKRRQEQQETQERMKELAEKMTTLRKTEAEKLSKLINQELDELEMKQAKCHMLVKQREEFNKNGLDVVEIYITTNIGEEEKPLNKIASGGEMSRIMLAIKSVLSEVDKIPVLIFDEIDTGISGHAAKAVSQKMRKIAQNHQILCVTHLANIAAQAEHNFYISKIVEENKTRTKVEKLSEERAVQEIARIASGEVNHLSIEHAKQLRKVS